MADQQRQFQSSFLSLPSLSSQPSTSTPQYDSLASYLAQHGSLKSVQSNIVSVVTSVDTTSTSGMPVSTLPCRTPVPSFVRYCMPSSDIQVSSACCVSGTSCRSLPASTLAPSQNFHSLSNVNFCNLGVVPNVSESESQLRQNYPVYLSPLSITPSLPPVPAELVNLVAHNQFVDFKYLLPANLTVIAAQPLISLQSLSRISSTKLAQIQSFRDWGAAWAVYTSVTGRINPARLPDLLEYFLIISESANRPDFDWQKYDILFRQGATVSTDKRWGSLDPAIWIQCYGKSDYVSRSTSSLSRLPAKKASSARSQRFCYQFNYGGQCHRENCMFSHVCMSCRNSSHPPIKCRVESGSKRKESRFSPSPPPKRSKK